MLTRIPPLLLPASMDAAKPKWNAGCLKRPRDQGLIFSFCALALSMDRFLTNGLCITRILSPRVAGDPWAGRARDSAISCTARMLQSQLFSQRNILAVHEIAESRARP